MTRQRYPFRESVNRILRILEGKAPPDDIPETLTGEVLSTDGAMSDLAELMAGSLPNEALTWVLPAGVSITNQLASNAEVLAGTNTTKAITPAGRAYAEDAWGELYVITGTSTMTALPASTYTMLTGVFQNNYCDDVGVLISPDNSGQLRITKNGSYFISWQLGINGSSAITYTVAPYLNSGSVMAAASQIRPAASGSAISVSGHGFVYVSGSNLTFDLRVNPTAIAWAKFENGQLTVQRIGKLK